MKYENYLFDLYATLVDIHTNQKMAPLWKKAAAIMNSYGAVYTPAELKKAYRERIHEHEAALSKELGTPYPEIELGDVFVELLLNPPKTHSDGIWGDAHIWSADTMDKWCRSYAYAFRVISRIKFKLYPETIPMLERLRSEGKHIYLLSNAQRIFTRPELAELGLPEYFEDIFISSEYRIKKPEVRFMRAMLDKHGLDLDKTVMIGNEMKSDIMMAAHCGVNAILVNHDGYSDEEIRVGFANALREVPDDRRDHIKIQCCALSDID